jgi:hypothetical protein
VRRQFDRQAGVALDAEVWLVALALGEPGDIVGKRDCRVKVREGPIAAKVGAAVGAPPRRKPGEPRSDVGCGEQNPLLRAT